MNTEIEIVKDLLLPLVEDDKNYLIENINWDAITSGFIYYETDPKLLYNEIYKLELSDPEHVITKLPEIYQLFIYELAEAHVLGIKNTVIEKLLEEENVLFSKKVSYLKTLRNVISKQERQRIINELPSLINRVDFTLSDNQINSAIKKEARTDLKDKLKNWDKEMVLETEIVFERKMELDDQNNDARTIDSSVEIKRKSRIISLSWVRYAVAASIVITAGLFYFRPLDNTSNSLANVETSSQMVSVFVNQGLGYTSSEINKKLEVIIRDDSNRISSIEKMINQNSINNISSYKKELDNLMKLEGTYVFDNKKITLNIKNENPDMNVIYLNDIDFYLELNGQYFNIIESDYPAKLVAEVNQNIIEQLEKIIFEND